MGTGGFEHLLQSQQAQVGRLVGASDLEPRDFAWRDGSFERFVRIPELRHKPSNYRFQFTYSHRDDAIGYGGRPSAGRHHVKFTPGKFEEWEDHRSLEWEQVLAYVEQWLHYLSRELHSETYWEAVAHGRAGISGHVEGSRDEPLTDAERSKIEKALEEALTRIADLEGLRAAEYDFVRNEFDELKKNLRDLKRRGWAKMALGTFVNLATRGVVSTESLRQGWELITQHLRDLPGMLPPGM